MKIYEFSTWGAWSGDNKLFGVAEIEVEEKPKTYIGKGTRVSKDDIGRLQNSYGNRMYLLENTPMVYISAMIERKKESIENKERYLRLAKSELEAWEALKGGMQE